MSTTILCAPFSVSSTHQLNLTRTSIDPSSRDLLCCIRCCCCCCCSTVLALKRRYKTTLFYCSPLALAHSMTRLDSTLDPLSPNHQEQSALHQASSDAHTKEKSDEREEIDEWFVPSFLPSFKWSCLFQPIDELLLITDRLPLLLLRLLCLCASSKRVKKSSRELVNRIMTSTTLVLYHHHHHLKKQAATLPRYFSRCRAVHCHLI